MPSQEDVKDTKPQGDQPVGYTDPKFAPTKWGSTGIGETTDLEMPSGQWAQVRRPGPQGLMEEGIIQSLDSLTGIVENELIPQAEGRPTVDVKKVMADPTAAANMLHTMDRIVCAVVVQPKVEMKPNDVTRRVAGTIYTDMIDVIDKVFIMQFAMGGTKDLEQFREESAKAVGGVGTLQEPADAPK